MGTIALLVAMTRRGRARARLLEALAAEGLPARAWTPRPPWERPDPAPRAPVVVTRLPSGAPGWAMQEAARVAAPARLVVNALPAVRGVQDKGALAARLAAAGLATPPTVLVTRGHAPALDALPGERFVVKPAGGSGGRGVLLGRTREQAAAGARAFADASGPVVVQAQVDGPERRLLVVGDEVVAAMERVPRAADGRASLHYGARPVAYAPSPGQIDVARRAARLTDLEITGVDLVGDDVVLEVNACPGFAGLEAVTGVDVAGRIARWIARRHRTAGV